MGNSIGTILIVNRLVNDKVKQETYEKHKERKNKQQQEKQDRIIRLRNKYILDGLLPEKKD